MRYSKQREAIRTYMEGRHDHPTADSVYAAVREELPNISLGTVYRNLMQLVDAGELQVVNTGDNISRFDPTTTEHAHFQCHECGRVFDVDGPVLGILPASPRTLVARLTLTPCVLRVFVMSVCLRIQRFITA